MKGLQFFAGLAVVLSTAAPGLAVAQQGPAKALRIAYVAGATAPQQPDTFLGLAEGLSDYGYLDSSEITRFADELTRNNLVDLARVVGKDVVIQFFVAPSIAITAKSTTVAQAIGSMPDIIMTVGTPGTQALNDATTTTPILTYTDIVGSGFAASLSRPGGDVSGVSTTAPELVPKKIAILKEAVPTITRIAILNTPANPLIVREATAAADAARELGIDPVIVDFDDTAAFPPQIGRLGGLNADALYVPSSNYFTGGNRQSVCDAVVQYRLAAVSAISFADCSLIGYGSDPAAEYRKFGSYIDAIARGTKVGDLPVE